MFDWSPAVSSSYSHRGVVHHESLWGGRGVGRGSRKTPSPKKWVSLLGEKKVKIVFKLIQKCEVFLCAEGKEVRNESVALSHSSTFLLFCHRLSVCLSVFTFFTYRIWFFCLSDLLYVMFVCFTSLFMFNTHTHSRKFLQLAFVYLLYYMNTFT